MTPEQKANLTAAARISEISLRWTMNQLFFLIHSGLFSFAVTQFELGSLPHIGIAMLGFLLVFIWFFATLRAQYLVQDWNEKMVALELAQTETNEGNPVRVFVTEEGEVPSPAGFPIHVILIWLVILFMVVWVFLLTFSIYRYFSL